MLYALVIVDMFAHSCICTWNNLITAKAIYPLTFLKNYFLILKLMEYAQENTCVGVTF